MVDAVRGTMRWAGQVVAATWLALLVSQAALAAPEARELRWRQLIPADPADPAPYWLVSTRRPDALAEAVLALHSTNTAPDPGASSTAPDPGASNQEVARGEA